MDKAFGEALIASLPGLRRYALSLSRRGDVAEDLVQTTVTRALASRHQFIRGSRLEPWLFRILRNAWIDTTRQARSAGTRIDAEENPGVTAHDPGPGIEARLMLQSVAQTIRRLPEEQREVIHLVCVEELSYAEAAALLGIPVGTVMSRLSRGRKALAVAVGMIRDVER